MDKLQQYIIFAVILFLAVLIAHCAGEEKARQEAKTYNQSIKALQDSFKQVITRKDTFWEIKTVEMSPEEIMETDVYKTLSEEKQTYIKELKKTKGLLAATKAKVEATIQETNSVALPQTAIKTDSTITLVKGDSVQFQDTTGNYQYKSVITIGDSVTRTHTASIVLEPDVRTIRDKQGIRTEFRFGKTDGLQINVKGGTSTYQQFTKKQKRRQNIAKWSKRIGIPALVAGSIYGGFKLGQAF